MNLDEDAEDHEGRRTAAAVGGSAVIGVAAIMAMVWLFGILGNSPVSGASAAAAVTSPASASSTPKASVTAAAPVAASPSTAAPSSSSSTSPTSTLSLPPPELPTYTYASTGPAPIVAPPPGPATPVDPPNPGGSTGKGSTVSGLQLSCTKAGNTVQATVTFTTTAPVAVWVIGGGRIEQKTSGTGAVSLSASGKRASYCMASVANQRIGPIAPS